MNNILLSFGRHLLPVPAFVWQRQVKQGSEGMHERLHFMSADHQRVRDFVVLELPRRGEAISPELIAGSLDLPLEAVMPILDELEAHLTFLYRDEDGHVLWAYPVTAAPTPHRILFSSGEQIYAA
jgi:hypothetical protein